MARTQEILEECTDLATAAFPEDGGTCNAKDAALYLAHTERGESIRALAQASGAHPSTVLRAVRRVEQRRDDPLIDQAFDTLGAANTATSQAANADRKPCARFTDAEVVKAALRFLRRLNEPGSFLVVTSEAQVSGIFCKANDFRKPIAMVPIGMAAEFVKRDWIRMTRRAQLTTRYELSDAGRSFLRRELVQQSEKRRQDVSIAGFAERPSPFHAQHILAGERLFMDDEDGEPVRRQVNLGETPLGWLARRKGPDGKPFLTPDEYEAGERLRSDFEMAQLGPSVAQDWRRFLTPGDRYAGTPVSRGPCEGPSDARARLAKALDSMGPGLSDVALRVCCFLEGIEATERRMGWNARSGKVVLKLALQRLSDFYGLGPAR